MKILEYIQAHQSNYKKGRTQHITHIVLHYVGAESTARNNLLYFSKEGKKASAHYFVDKTGIYQSVKEEDTAWHAGDSSMNSRSIGIEMCCKKDSKGFWYIEKEVMDITVELVKELMKKYNIPITGVIRHYDVTGKPCPEPWVRDTKEWDKFKERLVDTPKEAVEERYNTIEEVPLWGKGTIEKLTSKGYLNGTESGLDLSKEMLRILVITDRAGVYNK